MNVYFKILERNEIHAILFYSSTVRVFTKNAWKVTKETEKSTKKSLTENALALSLFSKTSSGFLMYKYDFLKTMLFWKMITLSNSDQQKNKSAHSKEMHTFELFCVMRSCEF